MESKTVEWLHRADRCVRALEGIDDVETFVREAKVLRELVSRCHLTPVPEPVVEGNEYQPPPGTLYHSERLCRGECGVYTPHECKDSGHERDSSGDYQRCCVCLMYAYGHGNYRKTTMQERNPNDKAWENFNA